jgi:hypothetical protein
MFAAIGWFMAHHPQRVYRFFTMGMPEQSFFVGFCRIVGWCFFGLFLFGAVMYAVLAIHDLFAPN